MRCDYSIEMSPSLIAICVNSAVEWTPCDRSPTHVVRLNGWLLVATYGILPFPLMIMTLVAINRPSFRSLSDRLGVLRRFLTAEAPAGLGQPFEQG